MIFIYIDESGQFYNRNTENFFVVAGFSTENFRITAKEFKKWKINKFPRKFKYQNEIKFSDKIITNHLKIKTIEKILNIPNTKIEFIKINNSEIPKEYMNKNGKINTQSLYTDKLAELVLKFLVNKNEEIKIFCDHRHIKGYTKKQYKEKLVKQINSLIQSTLKIDIDFVDSKNNTNVQIADWIVGAIAHALNKKTNCDEYQDLLKRVGVKLT